MALFISSWRCSTLLGRVMELALGEACDWEAVEMLVTSGVPGMGEGEWIEWTMSLAILVCNDSCKEGGICFREARSTFPILEGIFPLLVAGMLRAMDVGLLGEIHTERVLAILSIVLDKSSSISIAMQGWVTMLLGHSMTECGDEIGFENC